MWKSDTMEEEIIAASKVDNSHEYIAELPQGYHTVVGDRGIKLSEGQRQRLAFARAMIRKPELLILDEDTSALDNISEQLVQGALVQVSRNRTNLIIAHRLSTIDHADKIIVLQEGRVVEEKGHIKNC